MQSIMNATGLLPILCSLVLLLGLLLYLGRPLLTSGRGGRGEGADATAF